MGSLIFLKTMPIENHGLHPSYTGGKSSDVIVPPRIIDKANVSLILGIKEDPEEYIAQHGTSVSENYKDVKYFQTSTGWWIAKPTYLEDSDFYPARKIVRHDLAVRTILRNKYPEDLRIPPGMAFAASDGKIVIVSRYFQGLKENEPRFFDSLETRYATKIAVARLNVRLRDLVKNNVLESPEDQRPTIIDFGQVEYEEPVELTSLSTARYDIHYGNAPFVKRRVGDNTLEPYLEELNYFRGNNYQEIIPILETVGLLPDEIDNYLDKLRGYSKLFPDNMQTFIAVANGTLPLKFLRDIGWNDTENPRAVNAFEVIDQLTRQLRTGEQFLVELGDCGFLLMTEEGGKINIKTIFNDNIQEASFTDGIFSAGSKGTNSFVIKDASVKPENHLVVKVKGGNQVSISPPDPEFSTQIWR